MLGILQATVHSTDLQSSSSAEMACLTICLQKCHSGNPIMFVTGATTPDFSSNAGYQKSVSYVYQAESLIIVSSLTMKFSLVLKIQWIFNLPLFEPDQKF